MALLVEALHYHSIVAYGVPNLKV